MVEEGIVFQPDDQGNWITVTDKGKISVRVLSDKIKIYITQEEEFEDLFEVLDFIMNLTDKRPLFGISNETANTPAK
tara:strand:- start:240 stop:470 length:231 start_codon:yes stop_codon:yes gene_type:complete